jgi:glucose-1-phosphate thymidylyltransferase
MKAVILAGGNGTRLHPLTLATNKHLLSLYDRPVIYYAIEKLVEAGVYKIMIVTSAHHIEDFVKLLGSGHNFKRPDGKQVQIAYGIQNEPNGIAYGLYIAKDYVGSDPCILYLGDNVIEDDITEHVKSFKGGARVFLKEVNDPHRFGIATIGKDNKVSEIIEKPKNPKSNLAVVGLYIYDNTVFNKMLDQQPSERGEYEITYLNNKYIEEEKLESVVLENEWFDIGTIDSLHEASVYMRNKYDKTKNS